MDFVVVVAVVVDCRGSSLDMVGKAKICTVSMGMDNCHLVWSLLALLSVVVSLVEELVVVRHRLRSLGSQARRIDRSRLDCWCERSMNAPIPMDARTLKRYFLSPGLENER